MITGINGYVGSQVCLAFLKHGGYQVRGTLRNMSDQKKYAEVARALGPEYLAQVELVDMDLLNEPSVGRAVEGCQYVVHVACPNPAKAPKNEQLVMRPAVSGTQSVLRAA